MKNSTNLPARLPSSQGNRQKSLEAISIVLVYIALKWQNIPTETLALSESQKEALTELKVLPPNFTWQQEKVRVGEYVWLKMASMLQKRGFGKDSLKAFRAYLFASTAPFVDEEETKRRPTLSLTPLEMMICSVFFQQTDIVLYLCKDGYLSRNPAVAIDVNQPGSVWASISLYRLLKTLPDQKVEIKEGVLTKVDTAELELLQAVRKEEYSKVSVRKAGKSASYRWDMFTEQQLLATAQELHNTAHLAFIDYGEINILRNGKSKKATITITNRTRH